MTSAAAPHVKEEVISQLSLSTKLMVAVKEGTSTKLHPTSTMPPTKRSKTRTEHPTPRRRLSDSLYTRYVKKV